ncbi:MAG: transcription-repair coupling factor [Thermacetogeniaceae bacterium]|nr:transcription-repair coupling factor [Syntrophomonadaceae bacterium]
MNNILETIRGFQEALDAIKKRELPLFISGVSGSAGSVSAVSLFLKGGFKGALLVIVPGQEQVNSWAADLEQLLPERRVFVFDPAEALPFEVVAASREPAASRLETLAALRAREEQLVVVASIEALMPKLLPPLSWEKAVITLEVNREYDYNELPLQLVQAGYERLETAEAPGQFAVRGDIVDIYPFYGSPVRIEFWGDEISSLKTMEPETQRSTDSLDLVRIWPVREFIYEPELANAALERIEQAYKKRRTQLKGKKSPLLRLQQRANRLLEMARTGTGGSLNLVQPYFYPEQVSLLDYLPEDSLVILDEPGRLLEQVKGRTALLESDYRRLFQEGGSFTPWQEYYFSGEQLFAGMEAFPLVGFTNLLTRINAVKPKTLVTVTSKEMQPFLGRPDLLAQELKEMLRKKITILLLTGAERSLKQLERELREREISFLLADKWQKELCKGRLQVATGLLRQGFELPGVLAVITARELYGREKSKPRYRRKTAGRLSDLSPGDYVVHVHQGIGRFLGIAEKETDGSKRDYLEIAYAGDARLFVPVEQVELVQKYVGPEGATPRLSRMGGGDWTRLKQRVKKRVKELAQDLLALYAERERTKGYAFSPDTVWQKEFEEQFPYEETPDQLEAIRQVKADMEKARPMDRLLCGDVGFGKTEVAIRAAFKAVQDGKQVAVLVPTTVLAQQHYLTFKERFAPYPVQVDMLSRFRTPAEQRETINNLKKGLVDIIIGTHRLLSKDVVFKDLGLLVVDEEQRFGVAHKEKIKMLKANVDVLTMTATPIPRTLQMSLGGVRDLSLIETPPEDRLPVQTYVLEYDPEVVREAILKEIQRGGQVFYVHNRVQTIFRTARYLQGLVPEATFRVAHGQMKEEDLEKVMWEFLNQKFHCLVCTTIIESGLDFPNANTLIVENADWFGLSQLYQLRGRVGRSNRLAYAYFTFNRDKVLTEQAEKRLRALQEFTEFGSGFKLALRDLEIRGAGNILGAEQHGHMAAVGFDLYNQLLQEAVKELRGEKVPEKKAAAPLFDLRVDSYLPDDYIRDGREKVEIYRRLALVESLEEVKELAAELRDRFGRMPDQVVYLFDLALIRVRAAQLGIKDVQHNRHTMAIRFDNGSALHGEQFAAWSRIFGKRLSFSTIAGLEIRIDTRGLAPKDLVKSLKKALISSQQQ